MKLVRWRKKGANTLYCKSNSVILQASPCWTYLLTSDRWPAVFLEWLQLSQPGAVRNPGKPAVDPVILEPRTGALVLSRSSSKQCENQATQSSHVCSVIAAALFGSWPNDIMLHHGDGSRRGSRETDRGARLLTFFSGRLTAFSFPDWRKETDFCLSYSIAGFKAKLNYRILWQRNHPHSNSSLSVMVISLLQKRCKYGFFLNLFIRRWQVLTAIFHIGIK